MEISGFDRMAGRELGAPDLRIVDASYFLPDDGRDARAEYEAAHIPGRGVLRPRRGVGPGIALPHMLPSAAKFASRMQSLGIGDGSRIVVYDNSPLTAPPAPGGCCACSARMTSRCSTAACRNGRRKGVRSKAAGRRSRHRHFTRLARRPAGSPTRRCGRSDGAGRAGRRCPRRRPLRGDEPEPRPGLASGHMPGSRNLPQGQLFDADDTLEAGRCAARGVRGGRGRPRRPMVTTCGSGVTAAVLLFGAHLLGKEDVRSTTAGGAEWGADPATPKATGPA